MMPEYRVSIVVLNFLLGRLITLVDSQKHVAKERSYLETVPGCGCFIFFPVVSTRSFLFVQNQYCKVCVLILLCFCGYHAAVST